MRSMQKSPLRIFQTNADEYPLPLPYSAPFEYEFTDPKINMAGGLGLGRGSSWDLLLYKDSSCQQQPQERNVPFSVYASKRTVKKVLRYPGLFAFLLRVFIKRQRMPV